MAAVFLFLAECVEKVGAGANFCGPLLEGAVISLRLGFVEAFKVPDGGGRQDLVSCTGEAA